MQSNALAESDNRVWTPLTCLAAFLAVVGCFTLGTDNTSVAETLQWSPNGIDQHQWWRLVTGHWVHIGLNHLLLNMAGIMVSGALFDRLPPLIWSLGYLLLAPILISAGLLWVRPDMDWYRGFSGCLHGFFVLAALGNLAAQPRWSMLMLVLITAKLIVESFWQPDPGTAGLIGGTIIHEAHWLGAITGLVAGLLLLAFGKQNPVTEAPEPPLPE